MKPYDPRTRPAGKGLVTHVTGSRVERSRLLDEDAWCGTCDADGSSATSPAVWARAHHRATGHDVFVTQSRQRIYRTVDLCHPS